jgi:hypothetical protein
MEQEPAPEPTIYHCPHCGGLVSVDGATNASTLQCPHCGDTFSIAGPDATESEIPDNPTRAEADARGEGDLSELHIRQVSTMRKAAYRHRSWLIIGAILCAVGFAQLVYLAIHGWHFGLHKGPVAEAILAIVPLAILWRLLIRIRDLGREIRQSRIPDPATPPDFSTLSDGSQRWTNLEQMTNGSEER